MVSAISSQSTAQPARSRRRPPQPAEDLTRESVIEVALNMADTQGIDKVTIRGLAQHFGVTPMALYWHVKNKDELLAAMGDQVFAGIEIPDEDGRPWHETYRTLLERLLAALRSHPGAMDLVGARVLHNEKGLDLTERALSLLRGAGLSVQASADIARASLQTMMMLVSVQPGAEYGFPQSQWDELKARKRAGLAALPRDRYPLLLESASALIECEDDATYFGAGIDLFMAGVKAQVAAL
ncbi:Tetracyclin repressor, C-terminal all-alpha domain [Nakamurella panacisegetis]|uniref:Tetracyclin repressor, C-terminal all-alpha domain n=1 Tax=Nakamurella panacisegetis TaxID=1090615 RepID=A0A1H0HTI9_9ACTN|nr:TetR family transcriptional regulator [Nakamurella panacisegetis]SDO22111.1 Tetracyclin repressor, C-terminal all-alpha domain [Nakamurella panacisegetis]